MRIAMFIGTRPEAIKMAPVHAALVRAGAFDVRVVLTGQHREQLQHALSFFDVPIERNLDVMTERQSLPDLAARMLPAVVGSLRELQPDHVLVHGDTLTTFVCAWAAFLEHVPVTHVEAGLRSHDLARPFPEEANRRLVDVLADILLAPTPLARDNLRLEGIVGDRVVVTGQTGIDAILDAARRAPEPRLPASGPLVTITLHRRESLPALPQIAQALADVARENPDHAFVYPVHLNPDVQRAVRPAFENVRNVHLVEPLEYGPMAGLLRRSRLIITDSGGLQEEGAALGVPVAVVRDVTERPEGVASGSIVVVGTEPQGVGRAIRALLADDARLDRMARAPNPFGDGRAAERVAAAVAWRLGAGERPRDWAPEARTGPEGKVAL